jgi:anthranilate phosphoribosyltransferase
LAEALLWNLGAYLWLADHHDDLPTALVQARALLQARSGVSKGLELAS